MSKKPTETEIEVLSILWDGGPQTVRQIHEIMSVEKDVRYTTTLKIMQLMYEKGMLSRVKDGKTHIYKAVLSQKSAQSNMINRMLNTVFKGDSTQLAMQALGNSNPSKEELEEIRKYLDKLENNKND